MQKIILFRTNEVIDLVMFEKCTLKTLSKTDGQSNESEGEEHDV